MTEKKPDLKNGEKLIDPSNVSGVFLASVLGLAVPYVSALFSKRVILQNGRRGKYNLTQAVPLYVQSLRTSGTAEAGEKLKIQQERKLKIANDVASGELIKVAAAAEVFRASTLSWRAGASAMPRRLATELSNQGDASAVREILANEIDALFIEWEKPLREYFGDAWASLAPVKSGRDRPKTVAKKKPGRVGGRKPNPTRRKRRTRKMAK